MPGKWDVERFWLSLRGGVTCCCISRLALVSFAFNFPFILEVAVKIEDSGKGGSGFASSPKEEVDERAD